MHTHTARTEIAKLQETLDSLMPPGDHDLGPLASVSSDLIDLKVEFLGGRDVLAVAVHRDHDVLGLADAIAPLPRLVRIEEYGDDHRYFEVEGGPAMPPDMAGLVEDAKRTWALWYGPNGRPRLLWLYRDATGGVIGDPIILDAYPNDGPVGPAARTLTIRRKDNGWDQFAFVDDDGRQVACFTVDPRHVTLVHDRPTPPEWIGTGSNFGESRDGSIPTG